jgi:hypothetical protein
VGKIHWLTVSSETGIRTSPKIAFGDSTLHFQGRKEKEIERHTRITYLLQPAL